MPVALKELHFHLKPGLAHHLIHSPDSLAHIPHRIPVAGYQQQREIRRQEDMAREVARRRRIRPSDKAEVFARDNYTCQICGISKDFLDSFCYGLGDYLLLEADHIQSVSQGGTGRDTDNLQCLCWRCNRKKGGTKTNEQVRRLIDYGMDHLYPEDY